MKYKTIKGLFFKEKKSNNAMTLSRYKSREVSELTVQYKNGFQRSYNAWESRMRVGNLI